MADNLAKLILRLTVGGMMLLHGIDKLRGGIDGIAGMVANTGLPSFFAYGVYVGEIVAPLLLLAGYFTRPAAIVLAVNMVVAIGLAHSHELTSLNKHGGWAIELQAFYLFGAVAIALLGAGQYSASRGAGKWD